MIHFQFFNYDIYIYILEIKARQRRAKQNIYFMLVASPMKAGHPWFSRKCSNELTRHGKGSDDATGLENEVFHRQGRPCQGQVKRNPTRAAFGRPPFILITGWATKQLFLLCCCESGGYLSAVVLWNPWALPTVCRLLQVLQLSESLALRPESVERWVPVDHLKTWDEEVDKQIVIPINNSCVYCIVPASHAKLSGVGLLMWLLERQLVLPGVIFHMCLYCRWKPYVKSYFGGKACCYLHVLDVFRYFVSC